MHTPDFVFDRIDRCRNEHAHLPTLLVVDFFDVGDPNGGVQIANGLR